MLPIVAMVPACGSGNKAATTAGSTTEQHEMTWKYLQAQYGDFLSHPCDAKQLAAQKYSMCLMDEHDKLRGFKIDVNELPISPEKTEVLSKLEDYESDYKEFFEEHVCGNSHEGTMCFLDTVGLGAIFKTIGYLVLGNAKNS